MDNRFRLSRMISGSLPLVRRHLGPDGRRQLGLEFLDESQLISFTTLIYFLSPVAPIICVPWVLFFCNGHAGNLGGDFFDNDKRRGG